MTQLRALIEKLAADVPGREERQSVNITKVEKLICSQEMLPEPTKVNGKLSISEGLQEVSVVMLTDFPPTIGLL